MCGRLDVAQTLLSVLVRLGTADKLDRLLFSRGLTGDPAIYAAG